jgi:hypothetical protein
LTLNYPFAAELNVQSRMSAQPAQARFMSHVDYLSAIRNWKEIDLVLDD